MASQLELLNHVGSSILIVSLDSDHILFSNTQAKQNFRNTTKLSDMFSSDDMINLKTAYNSTLPQTLQIPYPHIFADSELSDIIYTDVFIDEITLPESQRYAILTFPCTIELTRAKQILDNTRVRFTYVNINDRNNPKIILQSDSAARAGINTERYFTTDSKVANAITKFIESNEKRCVVIQDRSMNFTPNKSPENFTRNSINRHSLPDIGELFDWKEVVIAPYYCEILITKVIDQVTGEPCLLFRETDITELKQKERQLQVELRRRKAASEFISNLSHEIRTPLNGVQGMLQYLAETDLTFDQMSCVSIAQSSAVGLSNLLNDVLDFSKIEAGKLSVRPAPVLIRDLMCLVEEVCHLFGTSVSSKGLSLYIDYPLELYYPSNKSMSGDEFTFLRSSTPSYLITDIMRVRQILINLVSNAVKYTSSGHVCVRLHVVEDFNRDSLPVRLEVEDTGEGIDTSHMSSIFSRFERVTATNEEIDAPSRPEGTGIGLAIAKQITDLLGGRFLLTSTIGIGSKFTLCLPRFMNPDNKLTPKSRKDKNRFASAPHIGLFTDLASLVKDEKNQTYIEELRESLKKVALNVICTHKKLLLSVGMENFLRSCGISACVSVTSSEELPKITNQVDIIYLLDVGSRLQTPTMEGNRVNRDLDYGEREWVNGVQSMIKTFYEFLFELYSEERPHFGISSAQPSHPVNNGKLILLVPLCCSRLIRRVIRNVPWFTSWISAPLIPSDLISLLCGNYNQQYIDEARPSPRVSLENLVPSNRYRVLAVDDNETNRMIFTKCVSKIRNDIQIIWAKSGAEAVELFENSSGEPFDLCFMDMEMPEMNGCDAARLIRTRERARNAGKLTIIALTANDTNDRIVRARYIDAGMDDGLNKPIILDTLRLLLNKYLPV